MNSPEKPLTERVTSSIERLASAAHDLNTVSGELGKAIAAIDTVLQTLNIGLPTWTTIEKGDDLPTGSEFYWSRDIGYAKVSNRWGISLRTVAGHYSSPDEENCESWLFNDAPRWLRIVAVEKIPDLLEALIKSAEETTKKIRNKTDEANQLAAAIAQAAGKKPAKRGTLAELAGINLRPSTLAEAAAKAHLTSSSTRSLGDALADMTEAEKVQLTSPAVGSLAELAQAVAAQRRNK